MTDAFTRTTLNYPINSDTPIKRVRVNRAPLTSDYKNFILGDEWLDTTLLDWWKLVDVQQQVALWVKIGADTGQLETFTGNSGGPVGPDAAFNINLLGTAGQINVVGNPATNTLTLSLTGGGTAVDSFIPDSGTSPVVPTAAGAVTMTGGTGIRTVGGTNTLTFNTVGSGLNWSVIGANQTLVINNGYICGSGGALSLGLPTTSVVGDMIEVTLDGSTSWTITQGVGQQIRVGNVTSTSGAGGSIASTSQGDSIRIVCRTANTLWQAVGGTIGALSIT